MKVWVIVCLLVCLSLLNCKSNAIYSSDMLVFTLEKTGCMGNCPIFQISIYKDGYVRINAEKYLKIEGTYESKISQKTLSELMNLFDSANFFTFESSYKSNLKDLPTTYISYTKGGVMKQVVDYDGAPQKLKMLEQKLVDFIEILDWNKIVIAKK